MKIYQCFAAISVFIFAYFVNCNIAFSKGSNDFSRVGFGGKSRVCMHPNVTYGKRINNDAIAYREVINKTSLFFKTVVEAKYPTKGQGPCNITTIVVENLYRGCDCFNEAVNVTSGGIGKKNMTVRITSEARCPSRHRITCWVKC